MLMMTFMFQSVDVSKVNSKLTHAIKTVSKMLWGPLMQTLQALQFIFLADS